jgi:hypothetical protein
LTKEQAIEKLLEEGEASNVAPLDANTYVSIINIYNILSFNSMIDYSNQL